MPADGLKKKNIPQIFFKHQLHILKSVAEEHKLPVVNNLPEVSSQFLQSFSRSRINFKNQWASHPTLEERTEHLEALQMNSTASTESAWIFFSNPAATQQQLTSLVYGETITSEIVEKDEEYFVETYSQDRKDDQLPEVYNGFYNGRIVSTLQWDIDQLAAAAISKNFTEIFNTDNAQLQDTLNYNRGDIETIKSIQAKQIDIKSFDFDGEKIDVKNAESVLNTLTQETDTVAAKLETLEKEAFTFFQQQSPADRRLTDMYKAMKTDEKMQEAYNTLANKILSEFQGFYQANVSVEFVENTLRHFKENEEQEFKEVISRLIRDKYVTVETSGNLLDKTTNFISRDYAYFSDNKFHHEELNNLNELIFGLSDTLQQYRWNQYKKMLQLQLEYFKPI